MEWASNDLSLTCVGIVNSYKSVHRPVPTLHMGIGNTLTIFIKQISKLSSQLSVQVKSLIDQTKEERKDFFWRV